MRTIEQILGEAKNKGLICGGLYERRTYPANANAAVQPIGQWRACFINTGGHRDEDVGATAAEALEEALARAKGLKGVENRPTERKISSAETEVDDLI